MLPYLKGKNQVRSRQLILRQVIKSLKILQAYDADYPDNKAVLKA